MLKEPVSALDCKIQAFSAETNAELQGIMNRWFKSQSPTVMIINTLFHHKIERDGSSGPVYSTIMYTT